MILHLHFQILISWLVTCCILRIFNKALSTPDNEFYQEPALLTGLLSAIDINLSLNTKLLTGKILHHILGICFAAVYYLIWYSEFAEISLTTTLFIAIINGLIRIIGWTFLLEIIPSLRLTNFKGHYLQVVFVHNIFTLSTLILYLLFW